MQYDEYVTVIYYSKPLISNIFQTSARSFFYVTDKQKLKCASCQFETSSAIPYAYYKHLGDNHVHDYARALLLLKPNDALPLCTCSHKETARNCYYLHLKRNFFEDHCIAVISDPKKEPSERKRAATLLKGRRANSYLFRREELWHIFESKFNSLGL